MYPKTVFFAIIFIIWNIHGSENLQTVLSIVQKNTGNNPETHNALSLVIPQNQNNSSKTDTKTLLPDLVVYNQHAEYIAENCRKNAQGVVNTNNRYMFLNLFDDQASTSFETKHSPYKNIFTLDHLNMSGTQLHLGYTVYGSNDPKEVMKDALAFYSAQISAGTEGKNIHFCIIKHNIKEQTYSSNRYKIYLVFPLYVKIKQTMFNNDFFRYPNNGLGAICLQNDESQDIVISPNKDTQLKAHLYIPTVKILANIILYAFLAEQRGNSTTNITIARFCSSDQSFKQIFSVDSTLIKNQITTFFNNNLDTIFYTLYTSQSQTNNTETLLFPKDSFSSVDCEISILDTLCEENTNHIKAQFLIKIVLYGIIRLHTEQQKVSLKPFYVDLFTDLPLRQEQFSKSITWRSIFFNIPSNQVFDQFLFFAYQKDAMPRNDVRPIVSNNNSIKHDLQSDNPQPFIIDGINDHGFITMLPSEKNMPSLEPIKGNNNKALALTYPQQHQYVDKPVMFERTDLLSELLKNISTSFNQPPSSKTHNPSNNTLFDFALSLINYIELLEKNINVLKDEIASLSMQHNDLFVIKKEIALKKQSLDATLLNIRTQIENLETAKQNTVKQFQEACKEETQQQIAEIENKTKNYRYNWKNHKRLSKH